MFYIIYPFDEFHLEKNTSLTTLAIPDELDSWNGTITTDREKKCDKELQALKVGPESNNTPAARDTVRSKNYRKRHLERPHKWAAFGTSWRKLAR